MDGLSATARLTALEQESPLAARLAELASLAVRVDAGLLRRLRQALLPEADPGVESDLWFSAIVESRGPTGFQLAGSVLPLLRQRLQADPARLSHAAAITRQAHAGAAAAVRLEESLNLLALTAGGPGLPAIDDAAAAALDPPLRALAGGGDAALDVARWAVRAAGRLDERVRRTRAAQTLLLAASLRLGMQRAVVEPARDDLPLDWLARMLPTGGAQRRIGVVRVAGGLQFREPEDGIASFKAPATDPLLVGLSWQAQGVTQQRTVEALPLAVVPLHGDPDELTLTTLSGDRYRLGSAPAGDAAQPGSDIARADPRRQAGCLQLRPLHGEGATRAGFIVDDGFGLTVAAAFEGVDHVVDTRSGRPFALLRSAADRAGADDLVVLKPASDDRIDLPPLPLGTTPPGQAAAQVAAIGRDASVRWLDVVLQARAGVRRQALLPTAPTGLGDTPLDEALLGAPVFDASGVVGAVVAAETLGDGSSGVRLRLVEVDALRERLRRARAPTPWLRWRVALVAVVDELGEALDAVAQALRTAGHEVWTPDRYQSLRGTLAAVDDSEVFVGLVGWRSGYLPDDAANPLHKPLLQLAFERARERRLPCLMALSRREVVRAHGKDFDDRMGMAAFREQLKVELPVIEFDQPAELASRLVGAIGQLPDRGAAPDPSLELLDLRVVHGDIREAEPPLLVGHYDGDGISGVERQLDELLQGALSRRFALGLYPGPAGTSALVRGAAEGAAAPAVVVAGLGTIGELSPSMLSDTVRAALLARAIEREPEAAQGPAQLRASCLLVGSGEGGIGVSASAIAIVEAALQANSRLRSLPGGARYQRIAIVEAVAERAAEADAALQRWAERSPATVRLAPAIERRHPPKEVLRGDWWHRLHVRVDDRGAFGYTLTAGGQRAEAVRADSLTLVDRLLASNDEHAGADPEWRRTLTELLLPAGLLSPLLMVDRLALLLDAAAAPYPWELLDRDSQPGRTPPLAARLGFLRQSAAPVHAPATPIEAGLRAGVFAADASTTSKQGPTRSAKDIALAVASRLEKAGVQAEHVVNRPVTELMARLYGEPLRLLHLAAPIAWPGVGAGADPGGAATGFRFGADLVLGASEIRQLRATPQLVFCSPTMREAGRPLKDWPGFAAAFAQQLLQAGVRAVVVPGWPADPIDLQVFTLAFYDALAQGRNFGDAVLYARGAAWKRDPKGAGWAAFQCWGNPGLTLLPTGDRRPAA